MGTPASPLALLTHCPPLSSRTLHVPLFIPTAVLCCGLQLCTNDAGFPGLSSEPLTTLLSQSSSQRDSVTCSIHWILISRTALSSTYLTSPNASEFHLDFLPSTHIQHIQWEIITCWNRFQRTEAACQCLHFYDPCALHGLSFLNIYIYNTRVKISFLPDPEGCCDGQMVFTPTECCKCLRQSLVNSPASPIALRSPSSVSESAPSLPCSPFSAPPDASPSPATPLRGIHPSHSFSPGLHPPVLGWPNSSFCKMVQKNPNFLVNPILAFCNSLLIQTFPPFSLLYPFCYPLTPTTTFLGFNSHNISSHFLNW